MSPMQHAWFGPPASTWSSVHHGLYGTVPQPHGGALPAGLPQQALDGL